MFARLMTLLGVLALTVGMPMTALGLGGPMSALDDYEGQSEAQARQTQMNRDANADLIAQLDVTYGNGLMIGSQESDSSDGEKSEDEDSSA